MISNLKELKQLYPDCSKRKWDTNFLTIPVTRFDLDGQGAHKFNEILNFIQSLELPTIIRTKSGGICNGRTFNKYNCWDYRWTKICAEITLLTLDGCWRFQCRTKAPEDKNGKVIYGSTALKMFKELCLKKGIDIDDYSVDNGMEIKAEWKSKESKIYKKQIYGQALNLTDKKLENVHHIDLCSGFQSGLARAFPEFYPVCKELYDKRKSDDIRYKAIQVESIGAMWSDQRQAKYIKLAKGAIEENNRLLMSLVKRLSETGRKPLLLNTDGIWYQGEVYHADDEKADLCGWKNDHINCTFRMKNNVTYEFIENGEYQAVMSGQTTLDQVKPRDQWEWGDIYKTSVVEYLIDKDGIKDLKGDLI